jgi:RNA polymerase sigma-70 factor (ECF subfamily)
MPGESPEPLPPDTGGTPPSAAPAGAVPAVTVHNDQQLLERFVSTGDEEAFALLVRRHGGLVFRLCERILADCHDAEDAFQATFMVLARKAAEIRHLNVLSSWLCGVATRVALRVRSKRSRRRTREIDSSSLAGPVGGNAAAVTDAPKGNPLEQLAGRVARSDDPARAADCSEKLAAVAEELGRLPEKHRAPLVLCYLEGKKNQEAADLLRWPVGTLKSRLSRAREALRARLARRGIVVGTAAAAALLSESIADVVVPAAVAKASLAVLGSSAAAISPRVAILARETTRAMKSTRLLVALAVGVAMVLLVGRGIWLATGADDDPAVQLAPPAGRVVAQPTESPPGDTPSEATTPRVAGERDTERPQYTCPLLTAFMRAWNDTVPDDAARQEL